MAALLIIRPVAPHGFCSAGTAMGMLHKLISGSPAIMVLEAFQHFIPGYGRSDGSLTAP
jgi:hypothetical protein